MPTHYTVSCINKDDRMDAYRRITHIGGAGIFPWKFSTAEAIRLIEAGSAVFTVDRPFLPSTKVVVSVSSYGHKYLRTEADGEEPNNLLSLQECP